MYSNSAQVVLPVSCPWRASGHSRGECPVDCCGEQVIINADKAAKKALAGKVEVDKGEVEIEKGEEEKMMGDSKKGEKNLKKGEEEVKKGEEELH